MKQYAAAQEQLNIHFVWYEDMLKVWSFSVGFDLINAENSSCSIVVLNRSDRICGEKL